MFEFWNWDSSATVWICLFKAIVCLFFCYLRVNIQKKVIEVREVNLIFMLTKTHRIHYFLHIKVHLADIEPKFVHDHFQLVLELPIRGFGNKVSFEDRMWKDLIPRNTVLFFYLQAPLYKVLCLRRQIFPFDV